MPLPEHLVDREKVAHVELGESEISRPVAWVLVGGFLVSIFGVPLGQLAVEGAARWSSENAPPPAAVQGVEVFPSSWRALTETEGGVLARLSAGNGAVMESLRRYEGTLEETSPLRPVILPAVQLNLGWRLGAGSLGAFPGKNGWIWHRPGVQHLTGPPFLDPDQLRYRMLATQGRQEPDPRVGILALREALAARNVELVVVVTPEKPTIEPEFVTPGAVAPLQNPSFDALVADLRAGGVHVYDPAGALLELARAADAPLYLPTDTHWTPQAVEYVAGDLAGWLGKTLTLPPVDEPMGWSPAEEREPFVGTGDIVAVMGLPPGVVEDEHVSLGPVRGPRGETWQPDADADVLLLGDSFTNIYSQTALGFGTTSGFAEHLSLALGRPIDTLLRNGDSSHATRELLARDLRAGNDRLAGKKVVIWQLATRELSFGDWRAIPMALGRPGERRFVTPEPGATLHLTGRISRIAGTPRPGTTPYKDQLVAALLTEVTGTETPVTGTEALVYLWGMEDGHWTLGARLRVGERVKLTVVPWEEAPEGLDIVARNELDDPELLLEMPSFGTRVELAEP